jgi:hypothetical protein
MQKNERWARAVLGFEPCGDRLDVRAVTQRYRSRALQLHPDRQDRLHEEDTIKNASVAFQQLQEAYELLRAACSCPPAASSRSPHTEEFERRWAEQAAAMRTAATADWCRLRHGKRSSTPRTPPQPQTHHKPKHDAKSPQQAPPTRKPLRVPPPTRAGIVDVSCQSKPTSPDAEMGHPLVALQQLRLQEVIARNRLLRCEALATLALVKIFCTV